MIARSDVLASHALPGSLNLNIDLILQELS